MENKLDLICEVLKTHDTVLCGDTHHWLERGNMTVYKDIIPIYSHILNEMNQIDDYCSRKEPFRCANFPRCYCTTNMEIFLLKKINSELYDMTAFLYDARDEFDMNIEKINGKWYITGCGKYEIFE